MALILKWKKTVSTERLKRNFIFTETTITMCMCMYVKIDYLYKSRKGLEVNILKDEIWKVKGGFNFLTETLL